MTLTVKNLIKDDIAKEMGLKFIPQIAEIMIDSKTFANALRRVLLGEIEAQCLTFNEDDMKTNDPFLINSYIKRNLMQVPIEQDNGTDNYSLNVVNNSPDKYLRVYTRDIKPMPKCNPNIELFEMSPQTNIEIKKIFKSVNFGYEDFAHVKAFACRSIPNGNTAKLIFETNGNVSAKSVLKEACTELVNRIKSLEVLLSSITEVDGVYHVLIKGENDTIGELIIETTINLFNVSFVSSFTNHEQNELLVRIRYEEDIKTLLKNVITYISDYYNKFISKI